MANTINYAIDPKALTFEQNKNGKQVAHPAMVEITVGSYTYKAYVSVYRTNAEQAAKVAPKPVIAVQPANGDVMAQLMAMMAEQAASVAQLTQTVASLQGKRK